MGSQCAREKFKPADFEVANQYRKAGEECFRRNSFHSALRYYQKTLEVEPILLKHNKKALVIVYQDVALAHQSLHNYDFALLYYKKILRLLSFKKVNFLLILDTYKNIAIAHEKSNNLKEAYKFYDKRAIRSKAFLGRRHTYYDDAQYDLAVAYQKGGMAQAALKNFKILLRHLKREREEEHPLIPKCYNYIGLGMKNLGKIDLALNFFGSSVRSSIKIYGSESIETATAYYNLALIQKDQRNFEESWSSLKKCAEIEMTFLGTCDSRIPETVKTMLYIVKICPEFTAEFITGIDWFEKQVDIYEQRRGINDTIKELRRIINVKSIKRAVDWNLFKRRSQMVNESFFEKEADKEVTKRKVTASDRTSLGAFETDDSLADF